MKPAIPKNVYLHHSGKLIFLKKNQRAVLHNVDIRYIINSYCQASSFIKLDESCSEGQLPELIRNAVVKPLA